MLVLVMSEINILYCFDNNFWRLAAVSINSLLQSKKGTSNYVIYCMVPSRTHGRAKIEKLVSHYNAKLVWKQIPKSKNPYRNHYFSRWSPVIFYRLFAHRIFPDLDKMLYIDSDTLIIDDLTNLYKTNLGDYALGAIRDIAPVEIPDNPNGKYVREFIQKYLKHNLYVNSGVLLLNIPKMAEYESVLLNTNIPLKYPDQDIINVALDGKIKELHLRYNFVPGVYIPKRFKKSVSESARKHPVIYHFYAAKPYFFGYVQSEMYSLFYKMASQLGFYPEDFVRADMKRHRKKVKYNPRTQIPYLHIDRRGRLRLFGFKI